MPGEPSIQTTDGGASGDGMTPAAYARILLDSLGLQHLAPPVDDRRSPGELWARSGAMWLSGHAGGPPRACPAPLATCAQGAWLGLAALCPERCDPDFDAFRLLGERAAIAGLARQGRVSAGGACRLLDTADGVLALNLARDDDRELLPAWLEHPVADDKELAAVLRQRETPTLVERGRLLGLAVAPMTAPRPCPAWFRSTPIAPLHQARGTAPVVMDLSSLWAGPLCTRLLSLCGARVIKIESSARPDGARFGPGRFFDLLNAGKESVALDLRTQAGRDRLHVLLGKADIVVESARPRALEQMDLSAADLIAANPGMVWLGITGYGRQAPMRDWVAYGDDAGVAAGLSWLMGGDRGDAVFCGDAIADPLTGLHAALLALASWRGGGGQLLDVALRDVAAYCIDAGGPVVVAEKPGEEIALPGARTAPGPATALGADTDRVLDELL